VKSIRTRTRRSTLGVPSLVFMYLLLGVMGVIFSSAFFTESLRGRTSTPALLLAIFLTVPAVMFIFLGIAVFRMTRVLLSRQPGGKLQVKILLYFALIAVLASAPVTIINSRFVSELVFLWERANLHSALEDAQWFALDAYRYRLAILERIADSSRLDLAAANRDQAAALRSIDDGLEALQDFSPDPDGAWKEISFAGNNQHRLSAPPAFQRGFLPRESGRDRDTVKYLTIPKPDTLRVLTFSLGKGFDDRLARIEESRAQSEEIRSLQPHLGLFLLLFYGAFSLPTLLMTMIIAVSLSGTITQPIVELSEALRRVAEGDFSVRILSKPKDEMGALAAAFNAMAHDLEIARVTALRTEKINIWQDMAQRLAHEIKNPLTPIKLTAERVLRRWKTDPEHLGDIMDSSMIAIIQEVDGLSAMLTEFRTFARLPSPTLARTGLRGLVEDTVSLYRTSYPLIDFECSRIQEDIVLKADRRHLSQVLTNLILNAVDAMDGKGRLEIGGDLVKKQDSLYCRLRIRDNGVGIPEQDRPKLFIPYFTTKGSGTGLGLPIVERIVTDHGGKIWFDSAEGVGTTFYIDLPVDEEGAGI
jgi:two-component system nitrogen regulation sensor histidine kinase NtrY